MKVSCLPISLFPEILNGKMSLMDWCRASKECDLDSIDISMAFLLNHTPVYIQNLKEALEIENVPIIMATAYPDFTHPSKLQREREMTYFSRDIALCSELNIKYLRVLAGQAHPDTAIADGIRWAIENIRYASNIADKYGVQLLYEDHSKPSAWHYTDFSFPPDIFLQILDGIWDTSVGVNFDPGNIVAYGREPLAILKQIMPKVETIHVSDMKEYGVFSPVLIGTGVVPLADIFSYLKNTGFNKWFCIEEASFQGLPGIKAAVKTVREIWDSIQID